MALNDNEESENSDEYYRELLARVDHAIVETRDGYDDDNVTNKIELYCTKCAHGTYQCILFVGAVVTETCVLLHEKVNQCFDAAQDRVNPNTASSRTQETADGYEL